MSDVFNLKYILEPDDLFFFYLIAALNTGSGGDTEASIVKNPDNLLNVNISAIIVKWLIPI